MPVRNEGRFIEQSLGAVLAQDYPRDRMEVIVADGMSDDETRAILGSLKSQTSILKVIDNPEKIVPTGMNRAFALSKGDIIVRVDGHCIVPPHYVSTCVRLIDEHGVDGAGGPIRTVAGTTAGRAVAAAMTSPFGVGNSLFRTGVNEPRLVDTVPFPAYRRAIMERAGPYDEEQVRNQDDEYNYRLRKLGAKILLSPELESEYYSRSNFRALFRQYYQYGYWKVRVLQKHPAQMQIRQFVPGVFVASIVAAAVMIPWSAIPIAVIGGSYLLVNVGASTVAGVRTALPRIPLIAAAFATLHIAYGMGFVWGLIRFAGKWFKRERKAWRVEPTSSKSPVGLRN